MRKVPASSWSVDSDRKPTWPSRAVKQRWRGGAGRARESWTPLTSHPGYLSQKSRWMPVAPCPDREVITARFVWGVENKGSLGFAGACAALGLLGPAGTWTAAVKKHWRQDSAELQPRELKRGSPLAEVTAEGMGSSSLGEPERRRGDADKSPFVEAESPSTAPPCGSAGQRQRRPRRIPGLSRAHPDLLRTGWDR